MNYRLTKYNPEFRTLSGAYNSREWTSFSDIVLPENENSYNEYKRVESLHLKYLMKILAIGTDKNFRVKSLEWKNLDCLEIRLIDCDLNLLNSLKENYILTISEAVEVSKFILRELVWCQLLSQNEFIHFGYDYYIYLGGINIPTNCIEEAKNEMIFIEEYDSPYLEN